MGILNRGKALLPEAEAYARYFQAYPGTDVSELGPADVGQWAECDVLLIFLGWEPRWRLGRRPSDSVLVADLCLSTGTGAALKDGVKRYLNLRPHVGVTQTESMARVAGWDPHRTVLRSQGYREDLVRARSHSPEYDLVYGGTLQRPGVAKVIDDLAARGFRVAVASADPSPFSARGVDFLGRLPQHDLYDLYSRSRAGLNVVPDRRPFNFQISTKVIEYLGAGIPVVSNRYAWIQGLSQQRGFDFIDVDRLSTPDQLDSASPPERSIEDLAWTNVMRSTGLMERIQGILAGPDHTRGAHGL